MEDVVLLDTGILFDFLADMERADEVERILSEGKAAVSSVTVYELFRGVTVKHHVQQRSRLLSFIHPIDLTEQIAKIAARLYTELKGKAILIENEDILIAATSLYHNIPLFTANEKHFARIPRLHMYGA